MIPLSSYKIGLQVWHYIYGVGTVKSRAKIDNRLWLVEFEIDGEHVVNNASLTEIIPPKK